MSTKTLDFENVGTVPGFCQEPSGDLERIEISLLTIEMVEAASAIAQSLVDRLHALIFGSKSLTLMRNSLLPRFVSGELKT